MMELDQDFMPVMEPPQRVLDATTPFFEDYGYRSVNQFIRSFSDSLYKNRKPHLLFVAGEPKNGKQHELMDIISRLIKGKKTEGVIPKIERKEGESVPIEAVYWGNAFSVGKIKGKFPPDLLYGNFPGPLMNLVTEEYEDLIYQALVKRQDKTAVITVKGVLLTGARIEGGIHGVNRGITAFEKIVSREGRFSNFDYELFTFGVVAHPDAVSHGNELRSEAEKKVDQPDELIRTLKREGEIILTGKGSEAVLSPEEQDSVVEYISESANTAASEEIICLVNGLAVELSEKNLLRLNGYPYKLRNYHQDESDRCFRFLDPDTRRLAAALVMRYIYETNLGLKNKVFIGKTEKIDERILDLSQSIPNFAKSLYPAIVRIKNK